MSADPQNLFRCVVPVRPSVSHPRYWDFQSAYLIVFLYAGSVQDAANRASTIAEELPYELATQRVEVAIAKKPEQRPEIERAADSARQCGLGLFLVAMSTGADAAGWLDDYDS